MSTIHIPYQDPTRYRVTKMTWDNGADGQGEMTSPDGRWFVPEDGHHASANWLRAEIRRLHFEVERLRRQIPATFDNGICLVCGVAHKDTGMPCPKLTVTSYSQSPREKL